MWTWVLDPLEVTQCCEAPTVFVRRCVEPIPERERQNMHVDAGIVEQLRTGVRSPPPPGSRIMFVISCLKLRRGINKAENK